MKKAKDLAAVLLFMVWISAATLGRPVSLQTPEPGLAQLLDTLQQALQAHDMERVRAIYAFDQGLEVVQYIFNEEDVQGDFGPFRILSSAEGRAYVMLTVVPRLGNSGDETIIARAFSGIYSCHGNSDGWKIVEKLEPGRKNKVLAHDLKVQVLPGEGLEVVDQLRLSVQEDYGFAVHLNHQAQISDVRDGQGRNVRYLFGGGLLWVDLPPGSSQCKIAYHLPVESFKNSNSGHFSLESGHVRNQFYWHPFFDFQSPNGLADFQIEATIPAQYQLVTSLPQEDRVSGNLRRVRGSSELPTAALALIYDQDWKVTQAQAGGLSVKLYASDDFEPAAAVLIPSIEKSYRLLSQRFGDPISSYLGIVQARSRGGNGWNNRTNNIVVAGRNGGPLTREKPFPRAFLGHEVAHGWTRPVGPAVNFLQEGWATFGESYLLEEEYGSGLLKPFWEYYSKRFFDQFTDRGSLLEDSSNNGLSYCKGAWVFRMLRDFLGEARFDRGMRSYIEKSSLHSDLAAFYQAFNTENADAEKFLRPWVELQVVPELSARIEGEYLLIEQEQNGPPFLLDLPIELVRKDEKSSRVNVDIKDKIARLPLSELNVAAGQVRQVLIDPEHRLLISRADSN